MFAPRPESRTVVDRLIVFLVLAVVLVLTAWPLFSAYRLHGDDFSPVLYSSAPYFTISQWHMWFTEGYSQYFLNYEGWPTVGTDFVRPVVNLGFYLSGFLAPSLGDAAYLVGNYLALVGTVLLIDVLLRRYSETPGRLIRGLISLSIGLSPIWAAALTEASFATNAYALFFSIAALAALDPRRGVPRGWRLVWCIALQVLAVGSHETAVAVPFVCVALLFAFAPDFPPIRRLWPFGIPVAYLALTRVLVRSAGGVYALEAGSVMSVLKRLGAYLVGPFVPFDVMSLPALLKAELPLIATLALVLTVLANVAIVGGALVSFRDWPSPPRLFALLAALAFARMPGALGRLDPRFMGLGFVVALIVFLALTQHGRGRQWQVPVVALLLASHVMLFYSGIVLDRDDQIGKMQRAGEYFKYAEESIADSMPSTVVLVNDDVAYFSARAMLEMAAWPRQDVEPIVINSFTGGSDPTSFLGIQAEEDMLRVEVSLEGGQEVLFAGAIPDFDLPANGFTYREVPGQFASAAQAFTATGTIDRGSTLVIGVDPRDGSFLSPSVY